MSASSRPVSSEPSIMDAARAARAKQRRWQGIRLVVASYAVDGLLLSACAASGLAAWWVGTVFCLAGWLTCAVAHRYGEWLVRRFPADSELVLVQALVAIVLLVGVTLAYPQLAFLSMMQTLVVAAFACLSVTPRVAAIGWLLLSLLMAGVLCVTSAAHWVPLDSTAGRALMMCVYVTTFGRLVILGTHGRSLRESLLRRKGELERALRALSERDAQLLHSQRNLERANTELQHRATHDPLTGLPNRALFADRLRLALARAARERRQLGVLVLDLDRFKLINDSMGHQVGDGLLCQVATRMSAAVRAGDSVARVGGDEFLVILPDIADRATAGAVATRVLESLRTACWIRGHEIYARPSIGISVYPTDGDNAEALLEHADEAMYGAKTRGGDCFEYFDGAGDGFRHTNLKLEAELRGALHRQEFELHYQPKLAVRSGVITSFEALLRWRHPTRGYVPPSQFIPIAEESGLILPIGQWVLREAVRQMHVWQANHVSFARVAVNVSPIQFRDASLLPGIRTLLAEYGVAAQCLEIEVTESTVMESPEVAVQILEELSRMGVVVAIDDFGTGYSSLACLRRLPVDKIKIDRSFISTLGQSADDDAIVRTLISLAHSLRLKVIAEGVETPEQLAQLRELQCDQYQGFLISPAVPAAEVEALLRLYAAANDYFAMESIDRTQSRLSVLRPA